MKRLIFQYFNLRIIIIFSLIYFFTKVNSNDDEFESIKNYNRIKFVKDSSYVNQTIAIPFPHSFEETYPEDNLDFIVLGDWGKNSIEGSQNGVPLAMQKLAENLGTQFIVNVGDNFYKINSEDHQGVESVNDPKWKSIWLDVYKGRLAEIPWYTVAGNHDWYNNISAQIDYFWTKNPRFFFPALFYVRHSYFGPEKTKVTWIHIDTNIFYYEYNELDDVNNLFKSNFYDLGFNNEDALITKMKWIEEKLAENQDSEWIFVVGHHPLIGSCSDKYYMSNLPLLFERYRVTAYFAGHTHVLEYQSPKKKNFPVAYFTSGAGSKTSKKGCKGDWIAPKGTLGFLHVNIKNKKLNFEFVDATTDNTNIIYADNVNAIPLWYPKK
ncbi:hypothetical protein Glove_227g151 [Diversispora epigaea]|uniref:Calcineurin-like phosphoesterase domain-containing protein n=1 Tax=Diversispora epigaea TaxID=1348612 RepID=A0A397ILI5_9GLOM|nr:hypothetical protein Glove_227g151 [Diversispora epigaea]